MRQPTFFLPHGGGPCFFLNENGPVPEMWRPMGDFLARVIAELPERPRAILAVSGHWEEPDFTVHTGERPDLLYDYGGFPPHTYRLRWDAPGAPDVARRAAELLGGAGFATGEESARGWDHGLFIPLKVAVPEADIPTAQLSLKAPRPGEGYDAAAHIAAGRALAALRDEGVLIVGSGMSFHNMRLRDGSAEEAADAFDAALAEAVTDPDPQRRGAPRRLGEAPCRPDRPSAAPGGPPLAAHGRRGRGRRGPGPAHLPDPGDRLDRLRLPLRLGGKPAEAQRPSWPRMAPFGNSALWTLT